MNVIPQQENHSWPDNLLPVDGIVHYHGCITSGHEADQYYQRLLHDISWMHDEVFIFGKHYITKRKTAWYADRPFRYTYSGKSKTALPWLPVLLELKELAEIHSHDRYNACLLNLYHDGNEGMSWHSDDEPEIVKDTAIASLSFGAERKFSFRHRQTKHRVSVKLEHGSLLVMKDCTQQNWLHSLPKTKAVQSPRINLTFRNMASDQSNR